MLPRYGVTGVINDGSGNTYNNIVGIVADRDTWGVTDKFNKVTSEYVGSEGYTTFHHHVAINNYIDARGNAVVLTLN